MRHRLLCCSDTHGESPSALAEEQALAWLHAGDLCDGPTAVAPEGDPREHFLLGPVSRWYAERSVPVYVVRGNHDSADVYNAFRRNEDLTGRLVQIADHLFVAGIGWHGEKYFELPFERDLEPICQSIIRQGMRQLFKDDRLILLTHYPPRIIGTHEVPNDRDGGGVWYDCIRAVVDLLEPIAVVQGHNHAWFGMSHDLNLSTRKTLIVNPGPTGCVLEVDMEAGRVEIVDR